MPDRHRHDGFIWALILSLIINLLCVFVLLAQREGAKSLGFQPFFVSIALNQQVQTGEHTASNGAPPLPPPPKRKKGVEPLALPTLHKNVQLALPTTDSQGETALPPESGTETAGTETDLPPLTTGGESVDAPGKEISGGLSIFGDKTAGDNYTAPEFFVGEKPPYPKQAERNGWAGTVLLNLSINANGEVEKVGIAKSSGYKLLDQQACQSVGAWRFKPARRNGHAIAVTVQQPIIFRPTPPGKSPMTSIRQQLQRSLLVTIAVIVLLMTLAFFLVEVVSFRQLVIESVVPKAELVAIHLRRPLALHDSWSAQEILATLATDPSIEGAYLFNRQAQPFAYYQQNRRADETTLQKIELPLTAKEEILPLLSTNSRHILFSWQHLSVFLPIIHNNETIGTVYVVSTLTPFYLRLLWWLLAAVAATAIAVYSGVAIARKLQERITAPISDLAGMMHIVTREGDLTQRAEIRGQGEIATLAYGFNQMLQALNHRDDELLTINFSLEERISERTQALNATLHEKELLLREVHHRVKNNLQIISSLLSLQMKKIYDPLAKEALRTSLSRIRSISLIHEKLYLTNRQTQGNDLGIYLRDLAEEIFRLHSIAPERIELQLDLVSVETDFDRLIQLALIFNELLTNTFKHAFAPTESGVVTIRLRRHKHQVILTVQDNGKGLPDNFLLETTSTVGLQLTSNLVRQAKGQFTLLRNPPGTEAVVSYPLATS